VYTLAGARRRLCPGGCCCFLYGDSTRLICLVFLCVLRLSSPRTILVISLGQICSFHAKYCLLRLELLVLLFLAWRGGPRLLASEVYCLFFPSRSLLPTEFSSSLKLEPMRSFS
jgi:hypothetical protein